MRTETLSFLIYLLSVGVLGLLGWQLYEKHDMRWVGVPGVGNPPLESVKSYRQKAAKAGAGKSISERRWSYGPRMEQWWDVIKMANMTGKLPPPPEELDTSGGNAEQPEPETPRTPLSDVVKIITTFGAATGVVKLQYKEAAGVQVPASPALGIGDAVPPSGGMASPGAPGQTQVVFGNLYQDIAMGESLYPPWERVKAERVVLRADSVGVEFSRPALDPEEAKAGKRVLETVLVGQLDITGKDFGGLDGISKDSTGGTGTGTGGAPRSKSTWTDPGEKTKKVGDVWQISIKDQKYLNSPDQLLEDVAVQDFVEEWEDPTAPGSGKTVRVKGVAIRKISPKLRRFGVQEGEILIKINGRPVSGRANAMNVGKQEYNRGVRNFQLTFLTTVGREVTRSYQAPDK